MIKNNFNQFLGFEDNEDIFIDTGIILALLNKYDAWHTTVKNLFNKYIVDSNCKPILYIHSGILTEVTKLADKPLKKYMEAFNFGLSEADIDEAIEITLCGLTELIRNEILNPLDADVNIMIRQLKHARYFDSTDALTVSMIEEYAISLLTLDSALVRNIWDKRTDFPRIKNLYSTTANYRDY